ncbi:MAG TPA: M48 family metalloprotease [Streptosporangiaceae bacterium]|nr:M48 family metalloprotease [Streptosporangiaceae bacterium]
MTGWRALTAVSLLGGFYILALSMIIGPLVLLTEGLWPAGGPPFIVFPILLLPSILAGIGAVLDGLRMGYRAPADSVAVSPSQAPLLWATVTELATAIGTRPPAELRFTAHPAAEVCEEAWFLGLVGGKRHLHVGVPLLAELSAGELRAVLAHELAHYAHHHTRLKPIAMRGWISLTAAVERLSEVPGIAVHRIKNRFVRALVTRLIQAALRDQNSGNTILAMYVLNWVFGRLLLRGAFLGYKHLYRRASFAALRAHELEADAEAVRLAGKQPMDRALRAKTRLDLAWGLFTARLVGPAMAAGYAPSDLFGAFSEMLTDSAFRAELDAWVEALARSTVPADDGDTHPSLGIRLREIGKLPATALPADPRPATALLADSDAPLIAAVREVALPGRGQPPVLLPTPEWKDQTSAVLAGLLADQLISAVQWADAVRWVSADTGSPALGSVLAAVTPQVGLGLLERMAAAGMVLEPDPASWASLRLHALIGGALVRQGAGHWQLSWNGPRLSVLSCAGLTDDELWDLAEAAVAAPGGVDRAAARLTELGLDTRYPAHPVHPAAEQLPSPASAQPQAARRRTLIGPVYSGGIQIADMSKAPRVVRYLLYTGMAIALIPGLASSIVSMLTGNRLPWLAVSGLAVGVGVAMVFTAVFLAMLARLVGWLQSLRR